mgnify:CR=1 FL=1
MVKEEKSLLNGTVKEDKEIDLYYQENIEVSVNYLDESTSKPIRSGEKIRSYVTELIDVNAKEIEGYTLIGKNKIHLVVTKTNNHIEFKYSMNDETLKE